MKLEAYWPSENRGFLAVFKDRAESVPDEVLLAVHQTFPIAYSRIGFRWKKFLSGEKIRATEHDLLDYLLASVPEGSLVVPITGASWSR